MFRLILLVVFSACLTSCDPVYRSAVTGSGILSVDSAAVPVTDSLSRVIIAPYRDTMLAAMSELLVHSEKPMVKGLPESELGNFVTDLVFIRARSYSESSKLPDPDFCLLNNGGFRSTLPSGDILLRHVYELMPFDNQIVIVEITGESTASLLNYICKKKGAPISNLRLTISGDTIRSALINGVAFNRDSTYRVITSDYLADGGDDMTFFKNPIKVVRTGIKIRDAIADHMRELGRSSTTLNASKDGRIIIH